MKATLMVRVWRRLRCRSSYSVEWTGVTTAWPVRTRVRCVRWGWHAGPHRGVAAQPYVPTGATQRSFQMTWSGRPDEQRGMTVLARR